MIMMRATNSLHRFIVFGCRPSDDLLVELHTDDFQHAITMQSLYSCENYKARIFDNVERAFIKPEVIGHAVQFLLT